MTNKKSAPLNEGKLPFQKGTAWNQHDAFFKDILANIDHARIFIKAILPKHIASMFNWAELEPQKDTFITPEGEELRADALFKLLFKQGTKQDYVYLLLEHKSSQQAGINSQIRKYTDHIADQLHGDQKIPHPVIPIVFYHGKTAWTQARRVDTTSVPKHYRKRIMPFMQEHYILFDVASKALPQLPNPLPEKLTDSQIVHIYLYVLRNIWRGTDEIRENFSFLTELYIADVNMAEKIVYYLSNHHKMTKDDILEIVNPAGKEKSMLTYTEMTEQIREEGIQTGWQGGMREGIQKGMQKGRQEGMQKGRQEGMQKGRQEGVQKGRLEGRQEGIEEGVERGASEAMHNLARNMLTEGLAVETIMRVTSLSEQDVRALSQ